MDAELKQFVEHVMHVPANYINVFGSGVPGLMGGSAGTQGAANAGSDVVQSLQRAVLEFARERQAGSPNLAKTAKRVEASLMAAQTLGVLSEKDARRLVDELYALVEEN